MRSATRWQDTEVDEAAARRVAEHLGLPAPLGRVLVARGLAEPSSAERFLNPRLSDLSDPCSMPGMPEAVARIRSALDSGEQITVFGDYDADGVAGTALLVTVLRELGGEVSAFLPRRLEEGYGFSAAALCRCLREHKPGLIVTVDCGTCAFEQVAEARGKNIDVVVTDHHEVSGRVAEATAVVNPKLGNDEATSMLAGVGVAFKVCHALLKDGMGLEGTGPKVDLRAFLDLVAVGTVADVAPLLGENRILVRHGLGKLNSGPSLGLSALAQVSGIRGSVEAYHLGFVIGPRLNAAGRLGEADAALELLMTDDANVAHSIATDLHAANQERKRIEDGIVEAAAADIDSRFDSKQTFGVVAGRPGWHIGTVGIVASRISARYRRPCVIVGFDSEGSGRGSCRSIEGIDLMGVLGECSDLLESFGGHEMAAGLKMRRENLGAFRERFNKECATRLRGKSLEPVHYVDGWIDLSEADERLWQGIDKLSPVGVGNPSPVWGVRDVHPLGLPRVVGKDHLKMIVAKGSVQMDSIGFGMADMEVPNGPLDMLVQLRENHFAGRRTLQLHIKDVRDA